MDIYCKLEEIFSDFDKEFLNEDENLVYQNIIAGICLFWTHCFKKEIDVLACLRSLDKLHKNYDLNKTDWTKFKVLKIDVSEW